MEDKVFIIGDFVNYVIQELAIQQIPKIYLVTDNTFARQNRSFGSYQPQSGEIRVYVANRNTADILRTVAHELVHHRQNELGMEMDGSTGTPVENEANSIAGVLLRNYGQDNELIYERLERTTDPATYQIYCDMDGVLCDFDLQFQNYFGMPIEEFKARRGKPAFYAAISSKGREFWSTMPWMPEGQVLWGKISRFSPIIVTSPGSFKGAKEGKLEWIQQNLNPPPADVRFEQAGQKQNVLMGKSPREIAKSVLIDDYDTNLVAWKAAGGKVIKERPSNPAHNHID